MLLIRKPEWALPEREATPEEVFLSRRRLLAGGLALFGAGALPALAACRAGAASRGGVPDPTADLYPAPRNGAFTLDRPLTDPDVAARYNNFYEFGSGKKIRGRAQRLRIRPWQVRVGGLVRKPRVFEIDELIRSMPLEERLYRFRCVEAWAMAVPWTGFRFSALMRAVEPASQARYVRFTSFLDRSVAPGQLRLWYPWPYVEGLTIEEAANELTLLATGIYGKPLPKQHGAPLRLVVPWKYGFKNIKSIVAIDFVRERPRSFWERLVPAEYGFWANVNPAVPHPRWSQASERMIGTGERRPTQIFNGYGRWVASLYPKRADRRYFM